MKEIRGSFHLMTLNSLWCLIRLKMNLERLWEMLGRMNNSLKLNKHKISNLNSTSVKNGNVISSLSKNATPLKRKSSFLSIFKPCLVTYIKNSSIKASAIPFAQPPQMKKLTMLSYSKFTKIQKNSSNYSTWKQTTINAQKTTTTSVAISTIQ